MRSCVVAVAIAALVHAAVGAYVYKEPMSLSFEYLNDVGPGDSRFGRAIDPNLRYIGAENAVYRANGGELQSPPSTSSNGESVVSLNVRKLNSPFEFDANMNYSQSQTQEFLWVVSGSPQSGGAQVFLYSSETLEEVELINPDTDAAENVTITTSGDLVLVQTINNPGPTNAAFGQSLLYSYDATSDSAATCYLSSILIGAPNPSGGNVYVYSYNANQDNSVVGSFVSGVSVSGVRGFGFHMALRSNTILVGAPDSNSVVVYSKSVQPSCTLSLSQGSTLTRSGGQFGFNVDIGNNYYVIGAPTDGTGKVYFYRGTTMLQELDASSSGTGPREFGARVHELNDYIFIGAPGGGVGQVLVYHVDSETSQFAFYQELENPGINPAFGTTIESNNCNRIWVGTSQGNNIVQVYGADIGAYYPDYCTCDEEPVPPYYIPIFQSFIDPTTICVAEMRTRNWVCKMDGFPGSICDYRDQTGYVWVNEAPTEDGATDECLPVVPGSRLVRKRAGSNCLATYLTPFSS
uniref:Uncharacterized protein n=1 Tax=Erythrolobus australicus TaxID=1077150 RepID=A0A7S1TNH5_9RHOD|mmetsp:Transcript_875/g.2403  ORF Transcript_875/g.2403 Transcript_875/m.2403 type:complete len:520 (+) Transcript_875:149-1708(+)|eukprot:CAMPEP_0185829638 /NCGR_PEP_ID=MMETSP1353-20130828/370_1 /TAXON_ID=1077150 /ORGANISM="Erythrolobus australicus, Strain CCMP3124" /LENGTH=519 /DNA_ID=CAMNT_0028527455 /DNA_START=123 /DNA_END=1682 /DNA_ORIENTATION=-